MPTVGEWNSLGCYRYARPLPKSLFMRIDRLESDTVSSRTLERSVDAGSMTVESCVSACQSQAFAIAGLEYASECCRLSHLRL